MSLSIHGFVAVASTVLLSQALLADDLAAWSAGIAYVGYDAILIVIAFVATLPLLRPRTPAPVAAACPTLAIAIAARDEVAVLPMTLRALLAQSDAPDLILIADDGSRDGTADMLTREFALAPAPLGVLGPPSARHPTLRWLRLPPGGKARALNAALLAADTEVVVTVDADTLLDVGAVAALRAAFAADSRLVAASGVLTPLCGASWPSRVAQGFQTCEYIRNALTYAAWERMDALLLIPGAFAGLRRAAVLAVGGFDPACMVEDYELIHRLRRYGVRHGLGWTARIVGGARAATDAPATVPAFLRQRRRWFCGFLQTQFWHRDMVGAARYGRLGTVMLPIKALDTLQPIYGLMAIGLPVVFLATGRAGLLAPIGAVIGAKMVLDVAFLFWSIRVYRRWADPTLRVRPSAALAAALIGPFTFQPLRHGGAAFGWLAFLAGHRAWAPQRRASVVAPEIDGEPVRTARAPSA